MNNLSVELMSNSGHIEPKLVAKRFHTTLEEVGYFTGVALSTLQKRDRMISAKAQNQLQLVLDIISKITPWAGNTYKAYAWYRSEPIPAFGGLTAENLVTNGQAKIVKNYIEQIALGGYA
ncbi:MAG: XRE family transcriptional regulator [Kangiellaceae bacterium]